MNTIGEKHETHEDPAEEAQGARFQIGHIATICLAVILLACIEREVFGAFTGSLMSVIADAMRSMVHLVIHPH